MAAVHDTRRQLGQIMVDEGFISSEQLAYALGEQARLGRPLGKLLVELGFVSEGAVANALAEQHGGLLKTEFGISAGLHPRPDALSAADSGVPDASVPEPAPEVAPEPEPEVAPEPEPEVAPEPEPEREADRLPELESRLDAALAERNALAQTASELEARSSEAAQAHAGEVAHVTAAAAARIAELEAELRAALATREDLETSNRLGAARIKELGADLAALRAQAEQRQAGEATVAEAAAEQAHLLFVPAPSGYALVEWPGPSPASGTLLDVDGSSFVVRRVGASPLPARRLRCAFLERV
ncbi:MAG TPA: hypothetical protein VML35_00960 [Gaiellaceae bacterium]|nr:hypothetical protein [Gaiellaceae bacterium]